MRVTTYLSLIFIWCLLASLEACKSKSSDPEPELTEQEKVTALLTGGTATWTPPASGITLAGIDVTAEYFQGFTIQFTATQLTTTGTTPVWLRLDTWQFKEGSSSIIIRGQDNKEVTIESISETELKLTLEWDQTTYAPPSGGRTKSLPGLYTFVMNK